MELNFYRHDKDKNRYLAVNREDFSKLGRGHLFEELFYVTDDVFEALHDSFYIQEIEEGKRRNADYELSFVEKKILETEDGFSGEVSKTTYYKLKDFELVTMVEKT